ncbi:hypothetical protein [Streptomyces sp. RTGN2]|uniref:hypothetical protein n=1 Tax=unclassified Streptomyces TaxID=2593676 RepID=UPI0025522946|nr:hypothetical protein [Streptomyces sp. RTGN2]
MPKNRVMVRALVGVLLLSNAVLLAFLISSDAFSDDEVAIGEAAPRGGTIALPEIGDGAVLDANRWPDACSFVNQEEIEAIFPGVKDIEHESRAISSSSVKDFAADSTWKASDRAGSGQCLYSMRLPGETYSATQFWVRIDAVADPELIVRYADRLVPGTGTNQGAQGADRCVITGLAEGSWNCRKGPLLFTVGGQTTVTFKGKPAPAPFVWRDDVLPEFVRTITAKIE